MSDHKCQRCGSPKVHPIDPMDNFPIESMWCCPLSPKDCRIKELVKALRLSRCPEDHHYKHDIICPRCIALNQGDHDA